MSDSELEQRAIDVIRGLAMDAPHRANSGHQGTAMALAPLATVLWTRILRYDAEAPHWFDRDRFILSNGHASILLYSMLHLTGYDLSIADLEAFRQWGSRTPGHPEFGHADGVEVTTGPLGQGFANGVGMGIAEQHLRSTFGPEVCDHRIYVFAGDGCMEEGVSHEAASLAGHLGLGRLIYVYDDNHITIDGPTELAFTDDTAKRFEAYGWHVLDLGDAANDLDAIEGGLREAAAIEDRPSLVILRSHIAYPSPRFTDDHAAHGNPFTDEEIAITKEVMGLPPDQSFYVPDDVKEWFTAAGRRHRDERLAWEERVRARGSELDAFHAAVAGRGLPGWETKLPVWEPGEEIATRNASKACFNAVLDVVPGLIGGAADLTGNTGVELDGVEPLSPAEPEGRQIHFGIREHGMASIMNGAAQHGGTLPVGGTFFVFSDYARPGVRLAALMGANVIYSFTHDSVGVGEDGPTHQPIEHLASLRAMPGLLVVRPADANETALAWRLAIEHDGPVALVLTRQKVPVLDGTANGDGVGRGGYVLRDPEDAVQLVLIGTGSEVAVCVDAADALAADGIGARVVSLPCWERFADQDEAYRRSVLHPGVPRLSVEAAATFGWERWADDSIGIDRFGASAPGGVALRELGINTDHVVDRAKRLLAATT